MFATTDYDCGAKTEKAFYIDMTIFPLIYGDHVLQQFLF
jgi:hypothetical protein